MPTETEWEKACRGTDKRIYAYGNALDPTKANTRDASPSLEQTNAVGIYPDGASPYGIEELIGKVWEWALDNYGESLTDSIDINNSSARVLRGGSFDYNDNFTCAASRRHGRPLGRGSGIGFRVVVSAPVW